MVDTSVSIRRQMRQARAKLTEAEQIDAAKKAADHLVDFISQTDIQHIALYLANDHELDPLPLIYQLWQSNKCVYLPILHPFCKGHLIFQRYTPDTLITINHYGIHEPQLNVSQLCPISKLNLIITPLVAFDRQGNRLGMGGGFYDRTLSLPTAPIAIGYAHDCQRMDTLPTKPWDIPLKSIITPSRFYQFQN